MENPEASSSLRFANRGLGGAWTPAFRSKNFLYAVFFFYGIGGKDKVTGKNIEFRKGKEFVIIEDGVPNLILWQANII
jgi:hypothetical protein